MDNSLSSGQGVMDTALNVAGRGVGVIAALAEAYRGGGPMAYLANRNALLQDPGFRGSAGPFLSGLLEISGSRAPQFAGGGIQTTPGPGGVSVTGPTGTPAERAMAGAGIRPGQYVPSFGPLPPQIAVEQMLAQSGMQALQQASPEERRLIGLSALGVKPTATMTPPPGFRVKQIGPGGATFEPAPPEEPDLVPVPGNPRLLYSPRTGKTVSAPVPVGAEAAARARANADAAAQQLGFPSSRDPRYTAWVRQQAGLDQPAAAPPIPPVPPVGGAPAAPPAAAAPPSAFDAIPGDTPVEQLPLVGYPPPAFLDQPGAQAPQQLPPSRVTQIPGFGPTPTAAPPAPAPTPPGAPPGTTATLKLGPLSIRRQGAPAQGKAVSAVMARQLASASTSAQAARAAIDTLRRGPQSALSVGGVPLGTPPAFTGPVSGRVLSRLATVSGQPLAVEESQLAALMAHARTGVFGIIGQRPNEQTLAMFDPLMPNVNQPTEIAIAHLERLAGFYEQLAGMEAGLSNLSPEQRLALIFPLFQKAMTAPGPNGEPPPVIDLR